ncbi:MAG: M23 family peptidase, partial [Rikenellaceae bacterium]
MKLKETILKLLYNLVRRRRVSIFEPRGGDELWYTHVSPLSGLFLFVAMLIIFMVAATALVSYTPVLEMLPGYKSEFSRSRERVVEGIMRLDSLERVIDDMMIYAENISLIMDGKTPIVRDIVKGDSLKLSKRLIAPNSADSALRRQIESDVNISMRSEYQQRVMSGAAVALIAPVEGEIASSFDIKGERYGVEIFTEPD